MSAPENTAAADPLEKFIVAAAPAGLGIEAQEAEGQRQLVESTVLPTRILHCTQADFEALGFVFGAVVDGDDLFREVTLPDGWKREGSDHSMWSHIIDARGVRMVDVFYKAAFYDRKAHMWLAHPGASVASKFIYGDDRLNLNPALTLDELREAKANAVQYLEDAETHPDIYKASDRALALLAAVNDAIEATS